MKQRWRCNSITRIRKLSEILYLKRTSHKDQSRKLDVLISKTAGGQRVRRGRGVLPNQAILGA